MKFNIPKPIIEVSKALQEAGFDVYLVGGCVRDLLMKKEPRDWDLTTNALPEKVQELFPDSFYENKFGTVGVKVGNQVTKHLSNQDSSLITGSLGHSVTDVVEVTTYRTESSYSDNRRPDEVKFAKTLEEDLKRRDFTVNAMALSVTKLPSYQVTKTSSLSHITCHVSLVDPYGGKDDIKNKRIRAVGDPNERFSEDALRMMRAVRFHSELGFNIEEKTLAAIQKSANRLKSIALERIRAELERIILSPCPSEGIEMLEHSGLLKYIIPELEQGIGVTQNLHHTYTVWEHNILALKTCPSKKLSVRLAALLHDVGKPRTKRGEGKRATFYNHDHVGARMTRKILTRLRFPKDVIDHATLLVDNHLFYYNVDEVTESAVRRVIARVGIENIRDLIDVRIGDRLGSGVPKAKPYRLRHFEYMVEKVSHDPISVKDLKISGKDLIDTLGIKPGPKIGAILDTLLGEVIENAALNDAAKLLSRASELNKEDLETLRQTAKKRIAQQKKKDEEEMKKKYWVK